MCPQSARNNKANSDYSLQVLQLNLRNIRCEIAVIIIHF